MRTTHRIEAPDGELLRFAGEFRFHATRLARTHETELVLLRLETALERVVATCGPGSNREREWSRLYAVVARLFETVEGETSEDAARRYLGAFLRENEDLG